MLWPPLPPGRATHFIVGTHSSPCREYSKVCGSAAEPVKLNVMISDPKIDVLLEELKGSPQLLIPSILLMHKIASIGILQYGDFLYYVSI